MIYENVNKKTKMNTYRDKWEKIKIKLKGDAVSFAIRSEDNVDPSQSFSKDRIQDNHSYQRIFITNDVAFIFIFFYDPYNLLFELLTKKQI